MRHRLEHINYTNNDAWVTTDELANCANVQAVVRWYMQDLGYVTRYGPQQNLFSSVTSAQIYSILCHATAATQRVPHSSPKAMAAGFATILFAACSGGDSIPSPSTQLDDWQSRLSSILPETSEFQRAILEDGSVSEAEHERARLAYVGCIEDAGVTVVDLELDEYGQIDALTVGGGEDPENDPSPIVYECKAEFYVHVAESYRLGLHPDLTEKSLLADLSECLRELGTKCRPMSRKRNPYARLLRIKVGPWTTG